MKILAILFGVILTLLGAVNYSAAGGGLVPIVAGLLIVLLGLLQGRWSHNNPLYGTLMLALLAFLASLWGIIDLYRLLTGATTNLPATAIYLQSTIGVLCLLYIGLQLLLIPDFWRGWKAFGQFLGDWLARVVLTFFYFTVFVPFGLGVRLFSDPLLIKSRPDKQWRPRTTGDQKLEDLSRQF